MSAPPLAVRVTLPTTFIDESPIRPSRWKPYLTGPYSTNSMTTPLPRPKVVSSWMSSCSWAAQPGPSRPPSSTSWNHAVFFVVAFSACDPAPAVLTATQVATRAAPKPSTSSRLIVVVSFSRRCSTEGGVVDRRATLRRVGLRAADQDGLHDAAVEHE